MHTPACVSGNTDAVAELERSERPVTWVHYSLVVVIGVAGFVAVMTVPRAWVAWVELVTLAGVFLVMLHGYRRIRRAR